MARFNYLRSAERLAAALDEEAAACPLSRVDDAQRLGSQAAALRHVTGELTQLLALGAPTGQAFWPYRAARDRLQALMGRARAALRAIQAKRPGQKGRQRRNGRVVFTLYGTGDHLQEVLAHGQRRAARRRKAQRQQAKTRTGRK